MNIEDKNPISASDIQKKLVAMTPADPHPAGPFKREIKIIEVLNGYLVIVGCQILTFESREKLFSELERYLKNRVGIEKEYLEKCQQKNYNEQTNQI